MQYGVAEYLNLRSEFEEIVSRNGYVMDDYNSTIDNLYTFISLGHASNRFRTGFERAMDIAETIVKNYESSIPKESRRSKSSS